MSDAARGGRTGAPGHLGGWVAKAAAAPPQERGRNDEAILVIGSTDRSERLWNALCSASGDDGGAPSVLELNRNGNGNGHGRPLIDDIRKVIVDEGITEVVVDADVDGYDEIVAALLACKLQGVRVRESVDFFEDLNHKIWLEAMSPEWLLFSDGFEPSRAYRMAKRAFDLVCAVTLLLVSLPLMALIALAVKLESPGPVLFKQERVGQNGRTFMLYKFRSMREDAESDTGPVWARVDDDRVTRIGALLRKTHLDELPQVINVIRNELSFVGPRPERPVFVEQLREQIPYYDLRLLMKPGVTGWAQVTQGYADSIEDSYEKFEYDLYYAKHASFAMDLYVIAKTFLVVLVGKGQ